MKFRELLKKLRLRSVQLGERPIDNVDGMASAIGRNGSDFPSESAPLIPPGYVPSQQDWGKPRH